MIQVGTDTYKIEVSGTIIAEGVTLEYACLFAKAIMEEYWQEPDIDVTIKREQRNDTE